MQVYKLSESNRVAQLPRAANVIVEGTRIHVSFPAKPDAAVLGVLKAEGFRWTGRAWEYTEPASELPGEPATANLDELEALAVLARRQEAAGARAIETARRLLQHLPRPTVLIADVIEYHEEA